MRFTRLMRAALAVMGAVAVAGGCDSATTLNSSPGPGHAGAYTLATVNASALPFDLQNDATGRVTVLAGTLNMGDGTFQQSLTLSETPPGGTAATRQSATQGTYTVSGDRILFKSSTGGMWEGTTSTGRIDYSVPSNTGSFVFSFRR